MWLAPDASVPAQQVFLVAVRRKPAQCVDAGVHLELLAMDAHVLATVDDRAPERSHRLEAGEDHVALSLGDVVLEVMHDAPAAAHPAPRDDDRAAPQQVDRHRFFGRAAELEIRQRRHATGIAARDARLRVVQLGMLPVDLGRLDGHRTVQEHLPVTDAPVVEVTG